MTSTPCAKLKQPRLLLFSRANAGSVASKPSPASRTRAEPGEADPYHARSNWPYTMEAGSWPWLARNERSDHRRTPSWTQPANHPPLVSRSRLNIAGFPATSMLVFQHTFAGFRAIRPQFLSLSLSYLSFFLVLRE